MNLVSSHLISSHCSSISILNFWIYDSLCSCVFNYKLIHVDVLYHSFSMLFFLECLQLLKTFNSNFLLYSYMDSAYFFCSWLFTLRLPYGRGVRDVGISLGFLIQECCIRSTSHWIPSTASLFPKAPFVSHAVSPLGTSQSLSRECWTPSWLLPFIHTDEPQAQGFQIFLSPTDLDEMPHHREWDLASWVATERAGWTTWKWGWVNFP